MAVLRKMAGITSPAQKKRKVVQKQQSGAGNLSLQTKKESSAIGSKFGSKHPTVMNVAPFQHEQEKPGSQGGPEILQSPGLRMKKGRRL
jgi:hypothetical protein